MLKKILPAIVTASLLLTLVPAIESHGASGLQERTKEEVLANFQKNSFDFTAPAKVKWDYAPQFSFPYENPGQINAASMREALNFINFARYCAGLPDDVSLDSEYTEMSQYAALLMGMSNSIGHNLSFPSDMTYDMAMLGINGAGRSNVGGVYSESLNELNFSFLKDGSSNNLKNVLHRRWMLSPEMDRIGMGIAPLSKSSGRWAGATYVMDNGSSRDFDYIAWPARGVMPLEFMVNPKYSSSLIGTPWSVSFPAGTSASGTVSVELKNLTSGKTWTFNSGKSYTASNGGDYMNVNTERTGALGLTVVFRPDPSSISYKAGDKYQVTLNGIGGEKRYTTEFISVTNSSAPVTPERYNYKPGDAPSSWAVAGVDIARQEGLILPASETGYKNNITREEFCNLVVNLAAASKGVSYSDFINGFTSDFSKVKFKDTQNKSIYAANLMGVVNGTSETTFNPRGYITRQEAACMLERTAKYFGKTGKALTPLTFADSGQIASWAKEGVKYVSGTTSTKGAVMGGVGNNLFSPKSYYTKEQSLLTFSRLYDVLK